jgi:hypothetical protein
MRLGGLLLSLAEEDLFCPWPSGTARAMFDFVSDGTSPSARKGKESREIWLGYVAEESA